MNIGLHKAINRNGRFYAEFRESLESQYLQSADIVLIQAGTRWLDCSPELVTDLHSWVEQGGRLMITHLGWSKTSCSHQRGDMAAKALLDIYSVPAMRMFREVATWSAPAPGARAGSRGVCAFHPLLHTSGQELTLRIAGRWRAAT